MVRSVAVVVVVVVGLLLAACGGAMSLTEYADALEASAADASIRFGPVVATLNAPNPTLADAQSAVKEAAVVGNDLHADLETLDPPDGLADLHAVLLDLHRELVAAQQEWAIAADTAQSVTELLQSSEARAALSLNDAALKACRRIQADLDATAERDVFEDVPWLPSELSESIEVALGCSPNG